MRSTSSLSDNQAKGQAVSASHEAIKEAKRMKPRLNGEKVEATIVGKDNFVFLVMNWSPLGRGWRSKQRTCHVEIAVVGGECC